jgi:XTP/dITP diphosphohydrolase
MLVASSNTGKVAEFRKLAGRNFRGTSLDLELLPRFSELPAFEESAPTFAENAAGKALHYSRFADLPVIADDSGLEVDALGGAPGVHSARYAGPGASDTQRNTKLLHELRSRGAHSQTDRRARFVCVIALVHSGRTIAVISAAAEGEILDAPRGVGGFGYDPVFWVPALGKTFAELSAAEKNRYSHRGKAFRKLLDFLVRSSVL